MREGILIVSLNIPKAIIKKEPAEGRMLLCLGEMDRLVSGRSRFQLAKLSTGPAPTWNIKLKVGLFV